MMLFLFLKRRRYSPEDFRVNFYLGSIYRHRGDLTMALKYFEKSFLWSHTIFLTDSILGFIYLDSENPFSPLSHEEKIN